MLQIIIPATEQFDEFKGEFITSKSQILQLEHSLVSLSKWESKWHKAFLSKEPKTMVESIDYIRCMTITQNPDPSSFDFISQELFKEINDYIENSMTATTFRKEDKKVTNREVITAEIIYYWMITLNIPFECQKWHLNRLLTLINVCNIMNQPEKKMSKQQLLERNRALNAARKKELNTGG